MVLFKIQLLRLEKNSLNEMKEYKNNLVHQLGVQPINLKNPKCPRQACIPSCGDQTVNCFGSGTGRDQRQGLFTSGFMAGQGQDQGEGAHLIL